MMMVVMISCIPEQYSSLTMFSGYCVHDDDDDDKYDDSIKIFFIMLMMKKDG